MEHKFKVGDRVEFIADDVPFRKGDVGVIIELRDDGIFQYKVETRRGRDIAAESNLRLVGSDSKSETPKPPFKYGDLVRVKPYETVDTCDRICEYADRMRTMSGRIIVVDKYDTSNNAIRAAGYWWKPDRLELVEESALQSESPAASHPYKVGDFVRSTSRCPESYFPGWNDNMDRCLGKIGEIVCIAEYNHCLRVRFDDGAEWTYRPEWVEPAEKPQSGRRIPWIPKGVFDGIHIHRETGDASIKITLIKPTQLLTHIKLD